MFSLLQGVPMLGGRLPLDTHKTSEQEVFYLWLYLSPLVTGILPVLFSLYTICTISRQCTTKLSIKKCKNNM